MTPERAERLILDLSDTSMTFERGHRLSLHVTSSNFPRFDVNTNTGDPPGIERQSPRRTTHTLLHDADHPSVLVLPISSVD